MPLVTILYRSFDRLGVHKPGVKSVHDDNIIERLSYHYTTFLLLIATLVVSTKNYVGDPIQCFCPAQFTHMEVMYTNYVCWVSNTYYLPFQVPVPSNYQARITSDNEITYYQYVPVILLLMAFILKLPRTAWKYGVQMSGVGLRQHLCILRATQNFRSDQREERIRGIAHYLGRWTSNSNPYRAGVFSGLRQRLGNYCFLGCGRHYGNYLVSLSIGVKFSYFAILFCLLFFLNEFLGNRFYLYGYEVLLAVLEGRDWTMSPRFPRVTMCDLELRQLTNVQKWTLQCVLPINLYNEVFFVFLWFWFTLLTVLSFGNFLHTLFSYAIPVNKQTFARKYLLFNDIDQTESRSHFPKLISRFVDHYLKADGIFILKLISKNSQTTDECDLVKYMWEDFRNRFYNQRINKRQCPTSRRMEGAATLPLVNGTGRLTHRYKEYYL